MIAQSEPTKYEMEKAAGERLPNGAMPLKQLKPVHLEMIAMHLDGIRNKDIALRFGFTESRISILLRQPKAVELIQRVLEDAKGRFSVLRHRIVDVLADGLKEGVDKRTQFAAIDRYHKMHDILGSKDVDKTAEDVIQEILKRTDSITIDLKADT